MTSAAMHENRPRQFRKTDALPFVKAPQAERPVELRRLDVSLRVTGIYAETTQEMHLFNPNSRPLSGEVIVPLPDAARMMILLVGRSPSLHGVADELPEMLGHDATPSH